MASFLLSSDQSNYFTHIEFQLPVLIHHVALELQTEVQHNPEAVELTAEVQGPSKELVDMVKQVRACDARIRVAPLLLPRARSWTACCA
ncbi:hypothetical protein EON66_06375 [archaeon]|nr:MAG: hypothetical protein EON66_06375 [archaeon]